MLLPELKTASLTHRLCIRTASSVSSYSLQSHSSTLKGFTAFSTPIKTFHHSAQHGSSSLSQSDYTLRYQREPHFAMAPPTAVTASMQQITTTKLITLAAQHATYELTKSKILQDVENEIVPAEKVRILLDRLDGLQLPLPKSCSVDTMRAFIEQSKHDPSVSSTLLETWEADLRHSLDLPSRKHQHAMLFGRLATEWLESGAKTAGVEEEDSFEPVGRKEMHEQRKQWEQLVFDPPSAPNTSAIETYLKDLFASTTESQVALKKLRESMEEFKLAHITPEEVKITTRNLLSSDLLNFEKQAALKDLRDNPLVLTEIADVLNMQLDALPSWSWGSEPVSLELRRALNGKYRVFMDEDLLTAILLEYIGGKWAVFWKNSLVTFRSEAWKKPTAPSPESAGTGRVPRRRKQRPRQDRFGVEARRWSTYCAEYYMQHLPDNFSSNAPVYGEDANSVDGGYQTTFRTRKQDLFHLIVAESLITSRLHKSWTILQSDFRWFGPSLPHNAILTVMKFFGVQEDWINFFQKYLTPRLVFSADGPNANHIERQCGVPISHTLTDVMGETMLFCLDFAVNQSSTNSLYRVHDDIWFWGSKEATESAWKTLRKFTNVMGLQLNEEKTGSAQIFDPKVKRTAPSSLLPSDAIHWGFLTLDSDGQWKMNEDKVKEHVSELKFQLAATTSIFAWIQAWNTYVARFLSANFGEPANGLGKAHIDMLIQTFKQIQEALFASSCDGGTGHNSVTSYLKSELHSRFGLENIPDGLLFFPHELGGLGLRNPLIPLMLVHEEAPKDRREAITDALNADEIEYNRLRAAHEAGIEDIKAIQLVDKETGDFISFQEFREHAERTSSHLGKAYSELMKRPKEVEVVLASDVSAALKEIPRDVSAKWQKDGYWKWILQLYGGEIIKEYGGLSMGDKRYLPIGLTSMLQEQRVRWQG